jgi:hypothetical protein
MGKEIIVSINYSEVPRPIYTLESPYIGGWVLLVITAILDLISLSNKLSTRINHKMMSYVSFYTHQNYLYYPN